MATQSVYKVPATSTKDLEDWYYISPDSTPPLDRLMTFSTYGQRYTPTSYRITFYKLIQRYPTFSSQLVRVGLPFVMTEKSAGKIFKLSHTARDGYYVQIVATPMGVPAGSNVEYQLHAMTPDHPFGINYVGYDSTSVGFTGTGGMLPFTGVSYGATSHTWDFGGGAICTSSCDSASPVLILGVPGTYTGRYDITMIGGQTDSREFQYTVAPMNPAWSFLGETTAGSTFDNALIAADTNFTHVVYLDTNLDHVRHAELTAAGLTNHTTVLRGPIVMARRDAIIHRGRIFVAYVDSNSKYLFLLVSNDLHPLNEDDWTQYSLQANASATFPVHLTQMGSRLGITYGSTSPTVSTMFGRSINDEPVAGSDWVLTEVLPGAASPIEQAASVGHGGRWWVATMDDAGSLRLGYSRTSRPIVMGDWCWMDLATNGEPGNNREGVVELLSVGDRLAVGYSRPGTEEITSYLGISDHPAPFHAGQFHWTAIDSPVQTRRLPGMVLATNQAQIFAFTTDYETSDGHLAWGDIPAYGQSFSRLTTRIFNHTASPTYDFKDMVYESESHVLVASRLKTNGDISFHRIQLQ